MVTSYNKRPHRSLGGYAPSEVTKQNADEVRLSAYFARNPSKKKNKIVKDAKKRSPQKTKLRGTTFKYKVNDLVRISFKRHPFQRGYQQKWTEELFKIRRRYVRDNVSTYLLKDLLNEDVQGSFNHPELQKVRKDEENTVWKIEEIVKKRKKNGVNQALVRWLGYPKKFDTWIPMSDIQNE
ncbi:Hypothetical predicted protein [Mytilus galloprovincialis]|uniref:Chromo domain-containing protein n=1 Tax=Mytilus galloprovincialis TaxID=29158 RepID=A0A8B6FGN4_MYTGA|nr:Hypothetical predicted protein [Mytilus galloprovincialis]